MDFRTTIDRTKTESSYGIRCQSLTPRELSFQPPFHPTFCIVPEGGETVLHQHFESEMFVILKGEGQMSLGQQTFSVKTGDTIFIEPFTFHQLSANAGSDLEFLSVYSARAATSPLPRRTLIAAAPPTPNGALHLGHLSGPYLAADAHARYLRQRGVGCLSLSGTDDHQPYIAIQAKKEQTSIPELLERYGSAIQRGLKAANISYDQFYSPAKDEAYRSYVRGLFSTLVREGVFESKTVLAAVDEDGRALTDPEISGNCPHCRGFVVGNGCEECGAVFPVSTIQNAKVHATGKPVTFETASRLVLPLERYRSFLERYHLAERPAPLRRFLKSAFARPLPDLEVTFPSNAGIAAAGAAFTSINPWIEMAAGYLLACKPDMEFIPAFGFDNVFYYSLVFPAVFAAAGRSEVLPRTFLINEFFHLEGSKFSTSRGHALWAIETLEKIDSDVIRFHLALRRPEISVTEFRFDDLRQTVDTFFRPLFAFLDSVKASSALSADSAPALSADGKRVWLMMAEAVGAAAAQDLVHFIKQVPPHVQNLPETERAYLNRVAARAFAKMAYPIMPGLSESILTSMGLEVTWDDEPRATPGTDFDYKHIDLNDIHKQIDRMDTEFRK